MLTVKELYNKVYFSYQRVVRGYDDRLFWSLRDYVDPMIVAHIKYLQSDGCGHPSELTEKKWNKILDTMLKGFVEEPEFGVSNKVLQKYLKNRAKALVLLSYYWDNLWD